MISETRECQNCKQNFVIEPEDFAFYERMKVPPPTFCFHCRLQRRMMWRNERTLYRRNNDAPGKEREEIVSIHHPGVPYVIYDDRTWWSDAWDPLSYGKPYDFSRPFFAQFKELHRTIPLINLSITNMVNCSYCNVSEGDKGCFMISASNRNEDCVYSNRVASDSQSGDLYIATKNELCYELVSSSNNFKVKWAEQTHECTDSAFLYDCRSCTDCIGCVNLRNKSYCLFNEQLDRETFLKRKEALRLDTHAGVEAARKRFRELVVESIHKYANNLKAVASTGDNLENVNEVRNGYDIFEAEHCKNVVWGGYGMRDSMDAGPGVGVQGELIYDSFDTALEVSKVMWTSVVYHAFDVRYSINCHSCSHLFGCYGLRSKEYCILNRQYTKEEYEALIPKIVAHIAAMPYADAKGRIFRYGDFFPYDLSPFAYNETVAQEYFPLTKEEAIARGFGWYDRESRNYSVTMKHANLPDAIGDVEDSICNENIECEGGGNELSQCTGAFRIVPQELALYRQLGVPLPRHCFNCRHYARLKLRNPIRLWRRRCQCAGAKSENGAYANTISHPHHGADHCPNEFETSYSPERKEIVYCEQCYQAEVV
jgi:hypothetical protein